MTNPADPITARLAEIGGWRAALLAEVRALIHRAEPDVTEAVKWRGVPVWEHGGILCTGESYQDKVKLTFAHGAALPDPAGLFNASLDGNTRRAIDLPQGAALDADAFVALIRAAVAFNRDRAARRPARPRTAAPTPR